jgi:hypothetical protein
MCHPSDEVVDEDVRKVGFDGPVEGGLSREAFKTARAGMGRDIALDDLAVHRPIQTSPQFVGQGASGMAFTPSRS